LSGGSVPERVCAALGLRDHPAWAVEPLCRALEDSVLVVQVAAIQSLGQLGDPRSVGPLTAALRRSFWFRSARRQALAAKLLLGGFLAALLLCAWYGLGLSRAYAGPGFLFLMALYEAQRRQSWISLKVSEALERIAERQPTTELARVLPELRAIASDPLIQADAARKSSRVAAARIEAAIEHLGSLPLAAAAPEREVASLPRAAAALMPDPSELPRVQ
jgi:hypothetical protein